MHQLMPHKARGQHIYDPSQPAAASQDSSLIANLQQDDDSSYNGESQPWTICDDEPEKERKDGDGESESELDEPRPKVIPLLLTTLTLTL
jgi:hypothetical protein